MGAQVALTRPILVTYSVCGALCWLMFGQHLNLQETKQGTT
jgi:hypothetical protein